MLIVRSYDSLPEGKTQIHPETSSINRGFEDYMMIGCLYIYIYHPWITITSVVDGELPIPIAG